MVRWIAFMLCFLFILPAFADKKKKTENIQELDEDEIFWVQRE